MLGYTYINVTATAGENEFLDSDLYERETGENEENWFHFCRRIGPAILSLYPAYVDTENRRITLIFEP